VRELQRDHAKIVKALKKNSNNKKDQKHMGKKINDFLDKTLKIYESYGKWKGRASTVKKLINQTKDYRKALEVADDATDAEKSE